MGLIQPFPYQGSKRKIARQILRFFPKREHIRLVEPFAGSAAVSIATADYRKATSFWINDSNKPLMELWDNIIQYPESLVKKYKKLWNEQMSNRKEYYIHVRTLFNKTKKPEYLLYLLARCVKSSIRYNFRGEFNQSPDNRRKGMHPDKMKGNLVQVSHLLKNRVITSSLDYKKVLSKCTSSDLVYMDPPYQGVCSNINQRYIAGISFQEFVQELNKLNKKNVPFIVSYDGRTGSKKHGSLLPNYLNLYRLEINAGVSTQSSLLGKKETTIESLYLSGALINKLEHFETNQQNILEYA